MVYVGIGLRRAGSGSEQRVLTLPEITKVEELVVPLCQDAQRVLDEGDNNQKSADSREVPEKKNTVSVHVSGSLVLSFLVTRATTRKIGYFKSSESSECG